MGRLNDHDPANNHATTSSRFGLAPETKRFRTSHYHPARGGMRGYTVWIPTTSMSSLDLFGSYRSDDICVGCTIPSIYRTIIVARCKC